MGADIRGKRCCSLSIHDKTTFTPGCTSSLEQATLGMYIYIYIYGKLSRVAAWLTSLESIFQRTLKSRSIPSWWRDSCGVRSSDHYTRYKLSHSSSHTRGPAHRYPRPILWHFFLFCNQSRIGLASLAHKRHFRSFLKTFTRATDQDASNWPISCVFPRLIITP